MRLSTWLSCVCLSCAASIAAAAPNFKITELWTGIDGPNGMSDWLEVTNFGDMPGDTSTLWYDDESMSVADGGQLDSFILAPGESAVFLVDADPADPATYTTSIEEFTAIWGGGFKLGLTNGGGGLSQNGDAAFLLLSDNTVVDSLSYTGSGELATFDDPTGEATLPVTALSVLGVNGAYESAAFVNETLALPPETTVTVIGSPGRIPEPTAAAMGLAALAGVALGSRRG